MTDEVASPREGIQKIWQILLIAIIAIAFTAVWLETYVSLDRLVWMNDFVMANRWTIPAGIIFFSLLVGICRKFLHAPDVISGGFSDALKGEGSHGDYRTFSGTLLTSFFSLLSGASIGPEGAVAVLVMEISSWIRENLAVTKNSALGFDVAALASAYNGIIGSPLFTAVLATEFNIGKKDAMTFLVWNLIAGVVGFIIYTLLGLISFARYIPFPSIGKITLSFILWAILLGILGAIVAIFMGMAMQGIGTVLDRAFRKKIMPRILCAGIIIAVVCYGIPELMFSGETTIHAIIQNPAETGILMLLLMGVLKILLLAISFKSGYLGGPVFPVVFTSTMFGLALSLVFPGVPVGIFVVCIMAAVITLALGVPLTAILLVAVMSAADQNLIVLIVISSVVALVIGIEVQQMREHRAAGQARGQ